MPTIVKTFDGWVTVCNNVGDLKTLNHYHIGDTDCNTYNDIGLLVDKYPNHPNLKNLKEATDTFFRTQRIKVRLDLLSDGHLQLSSTQPDRN